MGEYFGYIFLMLLAPTALVLWLLYWLIKHFQKEKKQKEENEERDRKIKELEDKTNGGKK